MLELSFLRQKPFLPLTESFHSFETSYIYVENLPHSPRKMDLKKARSVVLLRKLLRPKGFPPLEEAIRFLQKFALKHHKFSLFGLNTRSRFKFILRCRSYQKRDFL